MAEINPISEEVVSFRGKIIEVVQQEYESSGKTIMFEWARRGPGTRLILDNELKRKILIIKEYRTELNSHDYRLPGGKVYDKLIDYTRAKKKNLDMLEEATKTIIKESKEEVGLEPVKPELIKISKCGATVEWDLYYFFSKEWKEVEIGQNLELGEFITLSWVNYDEVRKMCVHGNISEDRTRGILLSYLLSK